MDHIAKRLSMGVAFVAVVAIFGMKDTGVFLKDYTPSNNSELAYHVEQEVKIIKQDDNFYYVNTNNGEVAVPKDVLLKKSESNKSLQAIKPTRLYNSINGEVIRIVLSEEQLDIVEKQGEYYKVKSQDGKVGFVKTSEVEPAEKQYSTPAIALNNKFLVNNDLLMELKKGEKVSVVDYSNGQYLLVDQNGNYFQANNTDVELDVPKVVVEPVVEKPVEVAAPVNPDKVVVATTSVKPETENSKPENSKPAVPAPVPSSAKAQEKINYAIDYVKAQLERPYIYADAGKEGYDCSGLIYDVFCKKLNYKVNRSSYDLVENGYEVERDELLPGDIVFFNTTDKDNSHVGMYIGNDEFIHASSGSKKVVITKLSSDYYDQRYSTARRIIVD